MNVKGNMWTLQGPARNPLFYTWSSPALSHPEIYTSRLTIENPTYLCLAKANFHLKTNRKMRGRGKNHYAISLLEVMATLTICS